MTEEKKTKEVSLNSFREDLERIGAKVLEPEHTETQTQPERDTSQSATEIKPEPATATTENSPTARVVTETATMSTEEGQNETESIIVAEARPFAVTIPQIKTRLLELQEFIKEIMKEGVDYGRIEGIPKPTLFKPGAEKLMNLFGLTADYVLVGSKEDWENAFFYYRYKALVKRIRDGRVVATCEGSVNSKETKYAYRWVTIDKVPQGLDPKKLPTKTVETRRGEFLTLYRIPTTPDEIYSQVNTIQKMAQKRALVGAVLLATRASDLFTQDVEDMEDVVQKKPREKATDRQVATIHKYRADEIVINAMKQFGDNPAEWDFEDASMVIDAIAVKYNWKNRNGR